MRSTRQNRAGSDENAPHPGAQSEEAESAGDESEDEEEVSVRGAFFYWRHQYLPRNLIYHKEF